MRPSCRLVVFSALLVLLPARICAQPSTCDEIQYYLGTGAPDSPLDGYSVEVQGEVHASPLIYDYKTFFIRDATGGLRLERPGWGSSFDAGTEVHAWGTVTTTAAGEIVLDVSSLYSVSAGEESPPIAAFIDDLVNPFDFEMVGDFVWVDGLVRSGSDSWFFLEGGGDSIRVDIDPETDIDLGVVEAGDEYRVTGFCVNVGGEIRLLPRRHLDLIENPSGDVPPVITDVDVDNWTPLSTDPITVSATIIDATALISSTLYCWEGADQDSVWPTIPLPMLSVGGDTYEATIPPPHLMAYIGFYIAADDGINPIVFYPGKAPVVHISLPIGFTDVRNIQYVDPMNPDQSSPDLGRLLNIAGRVTVGTCMDATEHKFFVLQQYEEHGGLYDPRWQAIVVDQGGNCDLDFYSGDHVRVFGLVDEEFGLTRIDASSGDVGIYSFGERLPRPAYVPIGTINDDLVDGDGALGEAYESVWIRTSACTVVSDLGFAFEIEDRYFDSILVSPLDNVVRPPIAPGDVVIVEGYLNFRNEAFEIVPPGSEYIVTGISAIDDGVTDRPQGCGITAVAPNPFNPGTVISFDLDRRAVVAVRLFDIRGSLVRTLHHGAMPAGNHEMTWNGRNDRGRRLSSGVYLCRLEVDGGFSPAHKVVLVQ